MADTVSAHTRMVIAYDNFCTSEHITAITLGNCSAATGSSVNNLAHENAWLQLTTTTPTANPWIKFQFNANFGTAYDIFGLVNADVFQKYDSVLFEISPDNSAWTNCGEINLATSGEALLWPKWNPDLLVNALANSSSMDWLRVTFKKSSGWPAFSIGNILFMKKYELAKNPAMNQFRYTSQVNEQKDFAIGGALHRWRGRTRRNLGAEYRWVRMEQADLGTLQEIEFAHRDKWLGVIAPDQAARLRPIGWPHLICHWENMEVRPQPGETATAPRYDVALTLSGGY